MVMRCITDTCLFSLSFPLVHFHRLEQTGYTQAGKGSGCYVFSTVVPLSFTSPTCLDSSRPTARAKSILSSPSLKADPAHPCTFLSTITHKYIFIYIDIYLFTHHGPALRQKKKMFQPRLTIERERWHFFLVSERQRPKMRKTNKGKERV